MCLSTTDFNGSILTYPFFSQSYSKNDISVFETFQIKILPIWFIRFFSCLKIHIIYIFVFYIVLFPICLKNDLYGGCPVALFQAGSLGRFRFAPVLMCGVFSTLCTAKTSSPHRAHLLVRFVTGASPDQVLLIKIISMVLLTTKNRKCDTPQVFHRFRHLSTPSSQRT